MSGAPGDAMIAQNIWILLSNLGHRLADWADRRLEQRHLLTQIEESYGLRRRTRRCP